MKSLLIVLVLASSLFSAKVVELGEKYQQSKKCKACHHHIVKEWENSWHSKSHFDKDEYFRATIKYVSRKTRKSLNSVKIQCATCHNPRISVTSTDIGYEIDALMNLTRGSTVDKALESDVISEGINCLVCHNVDKILSDKDESHRGINRVEWTNSGTMVGPFDDSKSPYHSAEYRDFLDHDSDKLCLVCHANDKSVAGVVFTNMGKEFIPGRKKCVDCHMGPKEPGIASTLRVKGKTKKRDVRTHGFEGAHFESFIRDALVLNLSKKGSSIYIEIKNPQPHNIPSGFGARELLIDVTYKKNNREMKTESISLTRYYTSKRNKQTIPHLAVSMTKDTSIPAEGKKILKVKKLQGATDVEVKIYYRLVNDKVRSILQLKEKIWSRKSLITSKSLHL